MGEAAGLCRHQEGFTALYWHFGPYGDQSVHVHSCFTEGCDRVLIGDGRKCDPKVPHRRMWLSEDGPPVARRGARV